MRGHASELAHLPDGPGAYVLVLACSRPRRVRVGALGVLAFRPGHYLYVGSARGGLRGRLARHLRRRKRPRWHVDYLRAACSVAGVVVWPGAGADECALSDAVAAVAQASVAGFGCSDCRCRSHLHYVAREPFERLSRLPVHGLHVIRPAGE